MTPTPRDPRARETALSRCVDDIVSCADEADGGKEDARRLCEQLIALAASPAPGTGTPLETRVDQAVAYMAGAAEGRRFAGTGTPTLAEWGDAVAAIRGCPGPPPAEVIERLIAIGDMLAAPAGTGTCGEDAAKLLTLLGLPCPKTTSGDDHDWHECPRCIALHELELRDSLARRLLLSAAAMLSPGFSPRTEGPR